jgi:hypothetical protein
MTLKVSSSKSNNMIQTVVIILLVAIFVYLVYNYFSKEPVQNAGAVTNSNETPKQMMNTTRMMVENDGNVSITASTPNRLSGMGNPIMEKMDGLSSDDGIVGEGNMGIMNANMNESFSNDRVVTSYPGGAESLTPEQLLPQDNSSTWNQVNPSGEGSLKDRNFLQSGFHIGINTVGQTLRNANLQLRSEPPCPQVKVSPWMTSTIEPDVGRRPFEIAGC